MAIQRNLSGELSHLETRLISFDPQSRRWFPALRRIVSSEYDSNAIDATQGDEAEMLMNFLDQALYRVPANTDLYLVILRFLRKFCGSKGRLPASYAIPGNLITDKSSIPIAYGGFSEIFTAKYQGGDVAVKHIKFSSSDNAGKLHKDFCKEVVIWKRLSHPRILSLMGVSIEMPHKLTMISEWMGDSHINAYLKKKPRANRRRLLFNVLEGLKYLHSCQVVHGDLKGPNILVDRSGSARLTDFGLSSVTSDEFGIYASTEKYNRGTTRWMAPELLPKLAEILNYSSEGVPAAKHPTPECDIYAFAMVVVEVITGKIPFANVLRHDVIPQLVERGERPGRPMPVVEPGLTDAMWAMVQRCWLGEPTQRPQLSAVLDCFKV